jgi:hypothetical protein
VLDAFEVSDLKLALARDYAGAADYGTMVAKDGPASGEVAILQCTTVDDRHNGGAQGRGRS